MIAVVAHDLFHGYIHTLAAAGWFRRIGLVDDCELIAVGEIDEVLSIACQMQVNPAMLVVVLRIGRGVGVGEAEASGIGNKDVGIVARVVTLAPVGCWPVGL